MAHAFKTSIILLQYQPKSSRRGIKLVSDALQILGVPILYCTSVAAMANALKVLGGLCTKPRYEQIDRRFAMVRQ
jgi:hypothetical protein